MADAPDPSDYLQSEAQTLFGVLRELEDEGYTSQFGARPGGRIRCFACGHEFAPEGASVETVRRLEGASDPADMVAVLPVTCPVCGKRGTLVLSYGPEAPLEDDEVLAALPPAEHAPEPTQESTESA
jgi:hypothetical protein